MNYRVQVTQEDLKNGFPCSSVRCPIALALRRQVRDGLRVSDDSVLDAQGQEHKLPPAAVEFINRFDGVAPGPLTPFEFEMEFPDEKN